MDLGSSNIYARGVTFDTTGGGWTISPGNTLNLGMSGLTVTGGGTTTIDAVIVIAASQTWSVATGTTFVHNGALNLDGGILTLGSNGALGSGTGTINFNGGPLQFAGDTTDYSGRFSTIPGQAYNIDVVDGLSVTFAHDLNGSLSKSGMGTLILSGTNDLSGGITLTEGILALESSGALGSPPPASINFDGGTLRYSSTNAIDYSGSFLLSENQKYRIDTNGRDVTFGNGLDSFGGSLTKLGSGTLTLEAKNEYNGETTIRAGTLALAIGTNSTGSIPNSLQITICAGASFDVSGVGGYVLGNSSQQTLYGSGTVIGNLSVTVDGTLNPGIGVNKIGTLTIQDAAASPGSTAVHVAINGTYNFNIATTLPGSSSFITNGSSSDTQTATTGNNHLLIVGSSGSTVDFTNATIKMTSGPDFVFDPEKSYSWKLATIPTGATLTGLNAVSFNVDNFADPLLDTSLLSLAQDGNFIVLNYSPVPEPAAVLGIAVGALAVGGFVRRRIHKPTA